MSLFNLMKLFSTSYVYKSDDDLMKQFQAGDTMAFEQLYERYKIPLYSYICSCVNSNVSDELFQEVMIKFLSKKESFRFESSFKTWLWTIAKNTIYDYWRSKDFSHEKLKTALTDEVNFEELPEVQMDSEQLLLNKVTKDQLTKCIEELPSTQREIIFLHTHSELTLQEIAQITNDTVGAIKSVLFRCKDKLIQCFKRG